MNIGSIGPTAHYTPVTQVPKPEATEKGLDRDNDGDEGGQVSATPSVESKVPGRSGVNLVA